MNQDYERYPEDAIRMNFTTNHDENSWNGTVFERFGDGHQAYAVLAFTIQGMPLLYSGQEAGLDKRLAFFEKDTIDWSAIPYQDFYASLVNLKKSNPALYNGSYGSRANFISTENSNVIAYEREKEGNKVSVLINLSGEDQEVSLPEGSTFSDVFSDNEVGIITTSLAPFQYFVGINNTTNE